MGVFGISNWLGTMTMYKMWPTQTTLQRLFMIPLTYSCEGTLPSFYAFIIIEL